MTLKDLINQRLQEAKESEQDSSEIKPQPQPAKSTVDPGKPTIVNTDSYTFDDAPAGSTIDTTKTKKTPTVVNTDDYAFEETPPVVTPQPQKNDTVVPPKKTVLNTEDYTFEDEEVKKTNPTSETFLNRYLKANTVERITGPYPYLPKFSYENLITNLVIDPLRGLSLRGETQMNDMLENFRLYGGIMLSMTDWKSGDVFAEVQYLPRRIDYGIRFERKAIYWTNDFQAPRLQKYTFQKLELAMSLPITNRWRVSLKPFAGFTRYDDKGEETPNPSGGGGPQFKESDQEFYGGGKAELVFDNSVTTGLNIIEGTRGKVSFSSFLSMKDSKANFSQVVVDIRHYQKIYKEIVFAVRGFGGSFMGNSPKKYLLGGMDNWIFNKSNREGIGNPLVGREGFNRDLVFMEYATTLRGFDYATFFGTSAILGNAELRVPLIRALAGGPIASNFFRNMQLTAFYDIGTSWTGAPSFGGKRSVRSRVVSAPPTIEVQIDEYLNPWLYSYGVGFRTLMFGYYLKADLAWPVENYIVQDPRVHITFGFDF
jgi:hypothetical protein